MSHFYRDIMLRNTLLSRQTAFLHFLIISNVASKMECAGLTSSSDSDWEELEVVTAFLALEASKYANRVWIHEINEKREDLGEFRLVPELREDPKRFQMYFRMGLEEFDYLHQLIESDIKKKNTQFRRAVSTEQRLAVCLR